MGKVSRMQQVGAPVGHQLQQTHSSSFLCNWSPRYYQAILYSLGSPSESVLSLSAGTLSASQFLLAPLPSLITRFLPSTWASLHGEQPTHKHAIYESIGRFYVKNLAIATKFDLFDWLTYQDSKPGRRLRSPEWYPTTLSVQPIRKVSLWWTLRMLFHNGRAHLWQRVGFLTVVLSQV